MNLPQFDIGELLVQGVDLRLPQAPQSIFYAGDDPDILAAIRRYLGEGDIINVDTEVEAAPKYCVFAARPDGRVDAAIFSQIECTFRKHGTEACVFQYCPIEKKFIGRHHEYFVVARIAT